jgi:hypothetical protein
VSPCLQALLRELAAFNRGLRVITTRTPIADFADHEGTSALRRDLEHLSREAGAKLLRALGVKGTASLNWLSSRLISIKVRSIPWVVGIRSSKSILVLV